MKNAMKLTTIASLLAIAAMAFTPASAASARIEYAKNQCVVGEQADGYLGFVPGAEADADLRREVRDANQQRKAVYADIARRTDVTVDVAATRTAQRQINEARAGQCVRDATGSWIKL